jgi:hypothetical protein
VEVYEVQQKAVKYVRKVRRERGRVGGSVGNWDPESEAYAVGAGREHARILKNNS